jgi:hypothetical protein
MNRSGASPSERSARIAILPPIIALVALALWNNVRKSAWTDEAFSFATAAHHPLGETIRRAVRFELQPPVYFALLNLWLRISSHIAFGRLLSVACAVGALVILWITARRLDLRRPAGVVWIGAATPGLVWAASEMRDYALVLFLVALANLLFITLVLTDRPRPRRTAVLYGVAALACLSTFYYSGFVLAGHWFAALAARRRRVLLTTALGIVAIITLPFVPTVLAQIASHPNPLRAAGPSSFGSSIYGTVRTLLQTIIGETPLLEAVRHATLIVLAVLCAAPVAWLAAVRARSDRPTQGLETSSAVPPDAVLAIAIAVPLLAVGTLRAFALTLVYPRHAIIALPGVVLILALFIDRLPSPRVRRAIGVAVGAVFAVCLVAFEVSGLQISDWRTAARYVAAHAAPGDPVIVAPTYEALPFEYYYRWPAAVVPVPTSPRLDTAELAETYLRDTVHLAARFDSAVDHRTFWLVESERPTVADYGRPILDQFVTRRYRVRTDTAVVNVTIRQMAPR